MCAKRSPNINIHLTLPNGNGHSSLMSVKFGVPLSEALKDDLLPVTLVDMVVYIAQEGVSTTDLFRRPGNPTDMKVIIKRLAEGKDVNFTNYNFYTLASVVKKFLLKIPGGIFGPDVEQRLLGVLELDNRMEQYDEIHSTVSVLAPGTQQLLALLFGTWFRIVNHSEYNTMSSEAVAKSIAGSLFHTCADNPQKVEKAVRVLQILIDDFGVANMFGRKNIQYFADMTRTGIRVREKFRYEYQYPATGSVQSSRPIRLFGLILQNEAKKQGFHLKDDAITEEEFYGSDAPALRRDTKTSQGSHVEIRLSSPPSPQSLQQQSTTQDDPDYNPHRKLTNVSSLSAPEVNEGYSPLPDLSSTKHNYLSTSLCRFDNVRRRQLIRMKKRSNWFLTPNTSVSIESGSLLGSRDASVGKCSIDATSSDALMSDVTASDGGISDTPASDGLRLSSDIDSTYADPDRTGTPGSESLQKIRGQHNKDILNANHGTPTCTSTPRRQLLQPSSQGQGLSRSPSPQVQVTEKEVRYFMVENFYGGQGNGHS